MTQKNRTSVLDPIDVVTGESYFDRLDFTLPGPIPFEWKGYYSSQLKLEGPLGHGWLLSCHRYVQFHKKLFKTIPAYMDGQGCEIFFLSMPKEPGEIVASLDGQFRLTTTEAGSPRITQPDGLLLTFQDRKVKGRAMLESISDENGQSIRFFYNNRGDLNRIIDSAGRNLEMKLDDAGRILSVDCFRPGQAEASGAFQLAAYRYDTHGNQVEYRDANGYRQSYQYDRSHQMIKRTDRNGYSFHYRYAGGKCVETRGDDGLFSGIFTYSPEERRSVFEGFDGRKIEYRYNEQGLVTEDVDPYGRSTKSQFDPSGNLIVQYDRCGRLKAFKYDERGNKTGEITATGQKSVWAYNDRNQVTEHVDPRGRKSVSQYDDRGNLTLEIQPDGGKTEHEYDGQGHRVLTRATDRPPEGKEYDRWHQLVLVRNALSGKELIAYEYDLLGNMVGVRTDEGTTIYRYDRMSRLLSAEYPDGTSEHNTFDPEGNITSYTDRLGNTWIYRYQSYHQMTEMIAPDGGVMRYEHTRADELAVVVDPNGNKTEYVHDRCDYVVEIRRNGQLKETYERDPEGRLLVKRDADGKVLTTLEYGLADRPVTRLIEHRGEAFENKMAYDPHGAVVSAVNAHAEVAREYDSAGRIVSETENGGGVRHQHDERGRTTQTDFGDGIGFQADYADNMVTITAPDGGTHTCYTDGSLVVERWLPDGTGEWFGYDEEGRLTRHVLGADDGDAHLDRRYFYDTLGRLSRVQNGTIESIQYDNAGRLEARISDKDRESYVYDPGGNPAPVANGVHAEYQNGNQLVVWGDRRYAYDYRGRLKTETRGALSFTYEYDTAGQLASVALPDGRVAEYQYDALRRRVLKRVGGQITVFGWDGDRLSWEVLPDGVKRYYFYLSAGDHSPVMFCDVAPESGDGAIPKAYFLHYDPSHRPILITDSAGKVVWSAEYAVYGAADVSHESEIVYNRRAPGQYFDNETGFCYNYHRYYDPVVGRYTQPDLIGLAGGLNLYAYGEGNPLGTCDVLGLKIK